MEGKLKQMQLPSLSECKIGVIGLGYVGLPVAIAFASEKKCKRTNKDLNRKVIAFDINNERINSLKKGIDKTNEINSLVISNCENILFTSNSKDLVDADVFIITVPTPIDENNNPDLNPIKKASENVGEIIKARSKKCSKVNNKVMPIVIYESTVFPGATEEVCVPIIEKNSDLLLNNKKAFKGFGCGYSPERINPGDKQRTLDKLTKVTSGSSPEISNWIDNLYGSIITAGTYKTSNIKVAEAAKIIENTQRDLNIALVNEFAIIFRLMKLDAHEIINAASTKWNFIDFRPGLVGGHCIGVDPYYLTYKANQLGYFPEIVLAGRRINNGMGKWLGLEIIKELSKRSLSIGSSNILVLGFTFKENCSDIRNTKVIDLVNSLREFNINVFIYDPHADKKEVFDFYNENILNQMPEDEKFEAIIIAVSHKEFIKLTYKKLKSFLVVNGLIFDFKNCLPQDENVIRF